MNCHIADKFYVCPNPTAGLVTVWSEAFQITDGEILVSDLSGRLELDLSNQTAGSYVVQLRTKGQVFYRKLIRE